ncbi:unnamed protein product [Protopolystoma xenopodis]|uniref:Uncharacterized protein n=1 Tax=Protopolystoma xenopodis TaxID=117903 RepID=A0A3S5FCQ0_9PLAT|nr:unnamed protein product [Protopolystoma xenopodis]
MGKFAVPFLPRPMRQLIRYPKYARRQDHNKASFRHTNVPTTTVLNQPYSLNYLSIYIKLGACKTTIFLLTSSLYFIYLHNLHNLRSFSSSQANSVLHASPCLASLSAIRPSICA